MKKMIHLKNWIRGIGEAHGVIALLVLLSGDLVAQETSGEHGIAKFPGGKKALTRYLANEVNYPDSAQAKDIEGKVIVQFTIKKGKVVNPKIAKSVSESLDKEALRVVHNMPKWQPAIQLGEPVKIEYMLPIDFSQ